jgi:pentapeptide MXKDX repeat protein
MKHAETKTMKYTLAILFAAALTVPAFAQDKMTQDKMTKSTKKMKKTDKMKSTDKMDKMDKSTTSKM